jgi:uncharacterized membrane protein YtjA (UPF0391 family)
MFFFSLFGEEYLQSTPLIASSTAIEFVAYYFQLRFYRIGTIFNQLKSNLMLRWTVIFLVVALIAALFGFGGIAAGAASIAKVIFFIFLVLFVISLLFGKRFGRTDV